MEPKHTHSQMDICIQNCLDCFKVCEQTLAGCFGKGNQVEASHLVLLKSCAEICHTSAKFMMMQSKFHMRTCEVCAEVCQACAESCEAIINDESMKKCAEVCRKCAESCSEMSQWDH
jgi:hypothetical protein